MTPKNGSKNAQNGSQQRTRLWPDSSVALKLTFEQRHLLPSQIKKLVARAERSNEPSTTAQTTTTDRLLQTDTTEIPLTEILDRIFTSAPGGVAAPKILPRDFL